MMFNKNILIPNILLLGLALLLYSRSFMDGHITRTGLLMVFSSLLPILTCVTHRMRLPLAAAAILANAIMSCMAGYVLFGTAYLFHTNGMTDTALYLLLLLICVLGILSVVSNSRHTVVAYPSFLMLYAAYGLYLLESMQWKPAFNIVVIGCVLLVGVTNSYSMFRRVIYRP